MAQFIPRIYNKIIIKILGYFWGVTVPTSRRRVNEKRKSISDQRRDVSVISASTSLKEKGLEIEEGIGKCKDEGTKSIATTTQICGEDTCLCIFFFSEKRLIVYRLIKCIIKSSMF